jgi:hypothetical protein
MDPSALIALCNQYGLLTRVPATSTALGVLCHIRLNRIDWFYLIGDDGDGSWTPSNMVPATLIASFVPGSQSVLL